VPVDTVAVNRIPGRGPRVPAICSRPIWWGRGICAARAGRRGSIHTIAIVGRGTWASQVRYKTADALCEHFVASWAWLGLPRISQIDNEMAATGGGRHAYGLSLVVRLHLWLGVHVMFLPLGEPGRTPVTGLSGTQRQSGPTARGKLRFGRHRRPTDAMAEL
jgi:hypothetical protein